MDQIIKIEILIKSTRSSGDLKGKNEIDLISVSVGLETLKTVHWNGNHWIGKAKSSQKNTI